MNKEKLSIWENYYATFLIEKSLLEFMVKHDEGSIQTKDIESIYTLVHLGIKCFQLRFLGHLMQFNGDKKNKAKANQAYNKTLKFIKGMLKDF